MKAMDKVNMKEKISIKKIRVKKRKHFQINLGNRVKQEDHRKIMQIQKLKVKMMNQVCINKL